MNTRRALASLAMFFSLVLLAGPVLAGQFVTTDGTRFEKDGKTFPIAGVNVYFLHYEPTHTVRPILKQAQAMNLTVLRTWGFIDGETINGLNLHPAPGRFDEASFAAFDRLLKLAEEHDLKLIIPLVNNWPEFGGVPQYADWFGISEDDFFSDKRARAEYKAWVRTLLERKNPLKNGLRYKDDPTIMAWELANEPRCESDPSGRTLHRWVREMSRFIKRIDPNHLVATGDEGFYANPTGWDWTDNGTGVDWPRMIELDTIDFATCHLYPFQWKKDAGDWSIDWIRKHVRTANRVGKPIILEEFALPDANRTATYKRWLATLKKEEAAGWVAWTLVDDAHDDIHGYAFQYGDETANFFAREAKALRESARKRDRSRVNPAPRQRSWPFYGSRDWGHGFWKAFRNAFSWFFRR